MHTHHLIKVKQYMKQSLNRSQLNTTFFITGGNQYCPVPEACLVGCGGTRPLKPIKCQISNMLIFSLDPLFGNSLLNFQRRHYPVQQIYRKRCITYELVSFYANVQLRLTLITCFLRPCHTFTGSSTRQCKHIIRARRNILH